ncbi:hypothetical protein [Nitrosospira multiformis]|uniref:Uncharacterized protein n=1 Tax=Nitrosospira multiformis TaxID=1231 RepID=A0A1I7HT34_9PROT|nr:hypothetical protein [Nitrosospira multiformis]SFU63729.1 hypothetical protein SAMN05216417_11187 [Nitrosospira multiformis]
MKMDFKLKTLAITAIMAASAPALAAIEGGVTGNGELLLNVRYCFPAESWPELRNPLARSFSATGFYLARVSELLFPQFRI